ncbi:MAG: hypothetical protein FWG16_03235 [Micrococcales bacterium]|nr:hypothetical protein [Micrococcales bacterium]
MKPKKFGPLDMLLAVAVVAAMGLNVYAFGFRKAPADVNIVVSPTRPLPSKEVPPPTETPDAPPEAPPEPSEPPEAPETPPSEEPPAPEQEPTNGFEEYRGFSDFGSASESDFYWFTVDLRNGPMPEDRTTITDFFSVIGYWKACTEEIPVFSPDDNGMEFFNIEISGSADQSTLTYHTDGFAGYDSSGSYDISAREGESYTGSFSGRELLLGDLEAHGQEITLMEFYWLDGVQYAVGEISYISGERQNIALVRP